VAVARSSSGGVAIPIYIYYLSIAISRYKLTCLQTNASEHITKPHSQIEMKQMNIDDEFYVAV